MITLHERNDRAPGCFASSRVAASSINPSRIANLPSVHRLCLLALLALAGVLAAVIAEEMYSDMFDHINPDDILPNDELRNQYYNCFMDTGPCVTEDQKFFKQNAAEAFATKCRKCTEAQKKNVEKIVVWYTENRPDEWNAMVQKLLEEAKKLNIPVA